MLVGIDHLVIACAELDAAAAELRERLGLEATGGGRHEALGTENRLVWLGDGYLELIAPFDAGRAAGSWIGGPVLACLQRGGGLATFALASDGIAADVGRLRAGGSQIGEPVPGERRRPDGAVVRWRLALPPALGPDQPPFLIEHEPGGPEWDATSRAARAAQLHLFGGQARLRRVELAVDDVDAAAQRYGSTLGIVFGPPGSSLVEAPVGDQVIRLLPSGHDRPAAGIVIAVSSGRPRREDLLGCRFSLELAEP